MKNKHTQGEWHVSKHGNNDSFGIYAEGNGNDLAIVKGGNEEGGEAEANSKLIAAAPELLKACVESLAALKTGYIQDRANATKLILEAINKATN